MDKFYVNMVKKLLACGVVSPDSSVLVLCGEQMDAKVFDTLGFTNVTITNLDERHEESWSTGAKWDRQNAEALSYPDCSYDLVAVHLGLHHCRMPHKALCEMYRVARKGVLVVEPCENWMVKIGSRLGVGQEYEVHAVASHGLKFGGVNNSPIPNYVFRWTLGEMKRTIASYAPEYKHCIYVRNHLVVHWHDLLAKKSRGQFFMMLILFPMLKFASWVFPQLGNNFGVFVEKPGPSDLQSWIELNAIGQPVVSATWFEGHIKPKR